MPSIEVSKLQGISAARAVTGGERAQVEARSTQASPNSGDKAATGVRLEVGATIEAGAPPVDSDRVEQVRAALREGDYPLVPAEIADAMIAARYNHEAAK